MKALPIRLTSGLLLLAACAAAQASDLAAKVEALEHRLAAQRHFLADFGGLIRYGSDNAELKPPRPGENRVVFLGDDITDLWGQEFFAGKAYVNRGIAGQTTAQMLLRFRQDVVLLQPKVVVIQGGTNDMAGFTGPATEGVISENFASMVDIARANGIRVVLASLTPVCDCFNKQTGIRPQGKIISLNGWIRDFAARSGAVYLDYYSALAEGRNLRKELTKDGLLPNDAGYAAMAPLADKAVAEALKK